MLTRSIVDDLTGGKPYVFVVMSYSANWALYRHVQDLVGAAGLCCVRADEIRSAGADLLAKVHLLIEGCEFVITDIGTTAPNVFFETGYAVGVRKAVLLLTDRRATTPTDLQGMECIEYDDTEAGLELLSRRLTEHIRYLLRPAPDPAQVAPGPEPSPPATESPATFSPVPDGTRLPQVFISHIEEDGAVAQEIARGLEDAGYGTWYYERDSLPGLHYLVQVTEAIQQCQVLVVLVTPASLGSKQVETEILTGFDFGKGFVPLLTGISHVEFRARQPLWGTAMSSATSLELRAGAAQEILPRILSGLQRMGVTPLTQS